MQPLDTVAANLCATNMLARAGMPYADLGLRILGIGMAILAWACVAFPGIRVGWKGGNRAPLSRRS
jgi:hypothetical protein